MDEPYRTRPAEKLHRTTSRVLEGGINHTIISPPGVLGQCSYTLVIIFLCSAGFSPLGNHESLLVV